MSRPDLRVVIAGGGIGGLCLAQGLVKLGVDVTVVERDATPTDRLQGYRFNVNPLAAGALQSCLPDERFQRILRSAGRPIKEYTFFTHRMGRLLNIKLAAGATNGSATTENLAISRVALREILLEGLGDRLRFGHAATGYRPREDGTVELELAGGERVAADLLVGADGAGSVIREQFLPHARLHDTGAFAVAVRVPMTGDVRSSVERLRDGPGLVVGPRGHSLFVAVQEFISAAEGVDEQDYVLAVFAAKREKFTFTDHPDDETAERLRDGVLNLMAGWHSTWRRLFEHADLDTLTRIGIRTSAPVDAWQPTNVTLLGDAIHSMTFFRGIGANTALRDAATLQRELAGVVEGRTDLATAVGAYEQAMRGYAFAAVKSSLMAMERAMIDSPVRSAVAKSSLRVIDRIPPLKRKAFGNMGRG
jgi:salicylate hydroxylase